MIAEAPLDLLPRDVDAEKALLGGILREPDSFRLVADGMHATDFSDHKHQRIFTAMCALDEAGTPINHVMLASELRHTQHLQDIGGIEYLFSLDEGLGAIFGTDAYCRRVKEKSTARQAITLLTKQISEIQLYGDTAAVLDKCEEHIRNLSSQGVQEHSLKTAGEYIQKAGGIGPFLERAKANVSTPLPQLTELLGGGFRNGEMTVVGARTSVGKTALGLQLAEHAELGDRDTDGVVTAIFSMEMDAQPLIVRMACAKAGISSYRLRMGVPTPDERQRLTAALTELSNSKIYFDETSFCTLEHLRRAIRQLKLTQKLGLVIIDYLQLMSVPGRSENRNQEVSIISRGLKLMAKELNLPFVVLSQLRRPKNQDDEPNIEELRESGSIGQDADVVVLLHKTQQQYGDVRITKLILEKQRNGPTGQLMLEFHRNTGQFQELIPAGSRQIVD